MNLRYLSVTLVLMVLTGTVFGQASIDAVTCNADKSVNIQVSGAQGMFLYISGCASTEGEAGIAANTPTIITFTTCGLQWGQLYTTKLSNTQGVLHVSTVVDSVDINCIRNMDPIIVANTLDVSDVTAGVSVTGTVTAQGDMVIVPGGGAKDDPPVTVVPIDLPLTIHMFLLDEYLGPNGFDISAVEITVQNSGGTIVTLTGVDGTTAGVTPGCQAKPYWSPVIDVAQGHLKVDTSAFMLAPGLALDTYTFTATLEVCLGTTCPAYDCTGNPYDASPQAGRRRREVSNDTMVEEINVSTRVRIGSDELTRFETDLNLGEEGANQQELEECEVCMKKSVMYGVTSILVLALVASLVASCFLFARARKSRKSRDDSELYSNANSAYKH